MLLKNQRNISSQRGMPVDDIGSSSLIQTITGETAQLYFWNSGVRTIDAGQAAGVVVECVLAYDNIKNAAGTMTANKLDTSLAFTAGALTTEVELDETILETLDDVTGAGRAAALTAGLSNGQYVVDYTNGIIYGKKASTATSLANVTYKIKAGAGSTSGGATSAKQDEQTALLTTIDADTSAMATDLAAIEVLQTAANASLDDIETVLEDVHDDPANLLRVAEQDPLNFAFTNEVLANVTNGADGTYYYYTDIDTFSRIGLQLALDGGSGTCTVTIEGSLQDDGTAPASCVYVDISTLFSASSWTASAIIADDTGATAVLKYLRVKVVAATGGANDADWKITAKKLY
jgi:hypothetical protein